MSTTLAHNNVPAEFIGQARQFRDRIAAENRASGEGISAITAPLQVRVRRGNMVPRRDALVGVADAWRRSLPPLSRLAIDVALDVRRKTLTITEMRLTGGDFRDVGWETSENGLILMLIGLECRPQFYRFAPHSIVHVGLHALARRFQRGLDASDAAVMDDLRALGQAHHGLADAEDGSDFMVPVAHGGRWRGAVRLVRGPHAEIDKALACRTYLADGM